MRLIDADALHLGKFVEPRTEWHQGWNDALDAATTQATTIDAVPVVRCKDCRWSHLDGWFCGGAGMMPEHTTLPESFCDHGKRKEADGNG